MSESAFTCDRCGRDWPERQMKEIMYEEGRDRIKKTVCPECLDEIMNESDKVRGIVGDEKAAAAHISGKGGRGTRQSIGERNG